MHIVYIYPEQTVNDRWFYWRGAMPARAINRYSRDRAALLSSTEFASHLPNAVEHCNSADMIVINPRISSKLFPVIRYWISQDKIIIYDFNDDHLPNQFDVNGEFLDLVYAATASSRRVVSDWLPYADVRYLPNFIDLKYYENILDDKDDDLVIGWAGVNTSPSTLNESGLGVALQRICDRYSHVKVMITAETANLAGGLNLPDDRLIYKPWVPYDEWGGILSKVDIGVAPLAGYMDERQSWTRLLEYMVMKIPWIASKSMAYNELRPYGLLVDNTPEAWEFGLQEKVEHITEYRKQAAGAPYLYAISQSIDENVSDIMRIYSSIRSKYLYNRRL